MNLCGCSISSYTSPLDVERERRIGNIPRHPEQRKIMRVAIKKLHSVIYQSGRKNVEFPTENASEETQKKFERLCVRHSTITRNRVCEK